MNESWRGLAIVLRVGLIVAAGIAIPATIVMALGSSSVAAELLATWRQAADATQQSPGGAAAVTASRAAIAALIAIPTAGYAAIGVMFVRRRRIAYATMTALQLVLLISVAVGAV